MSGRPPLSERLSVPSLAASPELPPLPMPYYARTRQPPTPPAPFFQELVDNMTTLRFSNLVFEPLWSRQYIQSVQIVFSENFGTEGRGGYFDK